MLDLKTKGLPDTIEVFERPFLLNTDFRVWLGYQDRMKLLAEGDSSGYVGFFSTIAPFANEAVLIALREFHDCRCELPRDVSEGGEGTMSFELDGELIFAAFWQAYSIDLTETDLHWHKFLALLRALPDNTQMMQVVQIRGYKGDDKEMEKMKRAWELPIEASDDERKAMEEFNELFG